MTTQFQEMDQTKLKYHPRRIADWLEGKDIYPLHVDVGPSNGCVYRCKHCYLKHLGHEPKMLSRDVMLNLMRSFGKVGVKSVFFAGSGEPLLNESVADAATEAKKAGVDVAMATNGLLMTAKVADKMVDALSWVRFSMQGGTAKSYAHLHGTKETNFFAVRENLDLLCSLRNQRCPDLKIGVMTCVVPGNEGELTLLANIAKNAGADYYTIRPPSTNPTRPVYPPLWYGTRLSDNLDDIEELEDDNFQLIIRRNLFYDMVHREYRKCYSLPFLCQVDGDGSVYACGTFTGNSDYCYGNLNEMSFEDIWASQRRKDVMRRITESGDFHACDNLCRMHNINKYLWGLKNPPAHVNFI